MTENQLDRPVFSVGILVWGVVMRRNDNFTQIPIKIFYEVLSCVILLSSYLFYS